MKENEFIEELEKINIFLNEDQLLKLDKFYNLLISLYHFFYIISTI